MTAIPNLWPGHAKFRRGAGGAVQADTPFTTLEAQAAYVEGMTGGAVNARVDTRRAGGEVSHTFTLVVPAADNYEYDLFRVYYTPGQATYRFEFDKPVPEAQSEQEFRDRLMLILGHPDTEKLMEELVALGSPTLPGETEAPGAGSDLEASQDRL